jgi:hypothetical protein
VDDIVQNVDLKGHHALNVEKTISAFFVNSTFKMFKSLILALVALRYVELNQTSAPG